MKIFLKIIVFLVLHVSGRAYTQAGLEVLTPPELVLFTTAVIICPESENGTAAVFPSGGTPPYTYLWSTGATSNSLSGLAAGN